MESRASRRRRISGAILHAFAFGSGAVVCLELALIIGYIFVRGIPGITAELLTTQPSYIHDTIGVLPNILNTLYIVLVAMAVVIPLGVCAAVYLSEYATYRPLVRLISFAVETLTGIPSVVFGLVGMLFFIQMMGFSAGVLSGGLTLAVMVLPTTANRSRRLSRGGACPWERQVAHGAHRGTPQCARRHRDGLHPGRRPHRR